MKTIRKLINRLLNLLRGLMNMPRQPLAAGLKTYTCKKQDMEYIVDSNAVCHIPALNGYFCECRRHTAPRDYILKVVGDYFDRVSKTESAITEADRYAVTAALEKPENSELFFNMEKPHADGESPLKSFLRSGDPAHIGLYTINNADEKTEVLKDFAIYASREIRAYKRSGILGAGKYQNAVGAKVMATYVMAQLLGLNDLIPETEYILLNVDGDARLGTFMKTADGICAMDIPFEKRQSIISPAFQKKLNDLNLLDAICHEGDHSPNNYNAVLDDDGMAVGVSAFDNNGMSTFTAKSDVDFASYKGCSPFVTKEGRINRPHISKSTVLRLNAIKRREVSEALKAYLNPLQVCCAWRRLKKVRRAVCRTAKEKPSFIIDNSEWNEKTVLEELSGEYGKTYLQSFIIDCKVRRT